MARSSSVFTLKTHRQPHEHSGPPPRLSISQSMDAAVSIAVLTISFVAHDGETHWMEGVQMLAVYVILALGFYFLPAGR